MDRADGHPMKTSALAIASLFLLSAATLSTSIAGETPLPAKGVLGSDQEVEWVYVGCAAFPVTKEAGPDDAVAAPISKAETDFGGQSMSLKLPSGDHISR